MAPISKRDSNICQSCKEDRQKQGKPPMLKVVLPADITDPSSFRKPIIPTIVCPHCDSDTLVNSALRNFKLR